MCKVNPCLADRKYIRCGAKLNTILFPYQARTEGGESWRCQEDKRLGRGGTCDYDCCIQCMANQGVDILSGCDYGMEMVLSTELLCTVVMVYLQ